jgi:amino acid transporter
LSAFHQAKFYSLFHLSPTSYNNIKVLNIKTMTVLGVLKDIFVPLPPSKSTTIDTASVYVPHGDPMFKHEEQLQTDMASLSDASTLVPQTQRKLKNRHVQLIGISGVIGTALFVAIGSGLQMGPGNLLLAFALWCIPILCITVSTAEMVCYLPINSPFIRLSGRCCDDAFEFMAGWNFWFLECVQIPFEIVAVNRIIHYWRDDYSPAITLAVQTVLYLLISIFAVRVYGETEFWLAIGKILLAVGLMLFTFITMVGGNPQNDAFGFRYWRNPGSFTTYLSDGSLGYFRAFLQCLIQASFTIAGPDYLSMVAGETVLPRSSTLPRAFKQIFYRLTFLFLGGCLCVGILVPYNSLALTTAIDDGLPGAGSSPYVIAMNQMGIKVLPNIVNAALVVSAFSAGNAYTYCSSRTLYGLALDGKAPRIFTYCNKSGVPILAVLISLCWAFISFLQMDNSSAVVLDWLINLITSCQLFNFCVMSLTYIFFRKAVLAQGMDRDSFTFKGWFQPYTAAIGFCSSFIMMWVNGYSVFTSGNWDYKTFLFNYLVIFVDAALFVFWKLLKRTKWRNSEDVDLVSGLSEIEEHEREYYAMLEAEKLEYPETRKKKILDAILSVLVGKD